MRLLTVILTDKKVISPELAKYIQETKTETDILIDWYIREVVPKTAYCVKCKKTVAIKDPKMKSMSKKKLVTGVCPDCGTEVHHYYTE